MRNDNLWSALARYCAELAPVVGPLLQAASDTASAIDRAATPPAALPAAPEND
jgi:hypothetical protein